MTAMNHYQQEIGKINGDSNFKALAGLRSDALAKLAKLELPHRRIENWKYTNLSKALESNYTVQESSKTNHKESTEKGFVHLYFIDGRLVSTDSKTLDLLDIKDLNSVLEENDGEESLTNFNKNSYFENDFADILNASAMSMGHFVSTRNKVEYTESFFFHHHFTNENSLNNYNIFYNIGKNSNIHILEEITADFNCLVNFKAHIKVSRDAIFGHYFNQINHLDATTFIQINAALDTNSQYLGNIINTGSRLSRSNIFIELLGENATADAHGLYLLNKEQHHDTMSYIKHSVASTFSNQLYKGILGDNSRGVFSGIIRIEKDAQLVAANQLNKNLLLSKKAHANSRPQLEIYADDVKCAHGSTTGQLSDEELFYFESRGIQKEKAREILSRAFSFDVTLKITQSQVRNYLQNSILNKRMEN